MSSLDFPNGEERRPAVPETGCEKERSSQKLARPSSRAEHGHSHISCELSPSAPMPSVGPRYRLVRGRAQPAGSASSQSASPSRPRSSDHAVSSGGRLATLSSRRRPKPNVNHQNIAVGGRPLDAIAFAANRKSHAVVPTLHARRLPNGHERRTAQLRTISSFGVLALPIFLSWSRSTPIGSELGGNMTSIGSRPDRHRLHKSGCPPPARSRVRPHPSSLPTRHHRSNSPSSRRQGGAAA